MNPKKLFCATGKGLGVWLPHLTKWRGLLLPVCRSCLAAFCQWAVIAVPFCEWTNGLVLEVYVNSPFPACFSPRPGLFYSSPHEDIVTEVSSSLLPPPSCRQSSIHVTYELAVVAIMTLGQKNKYFKETRWQKRMDKRHLVPFHGRLLEDTWKLEWHAVPTELSDKQLRCR